MNEVRCFSQRNIFVHTETKVKTLKVANLILEPFCVNYVCEMSLI